MNLKQLHDLTAKMLADGVDPKLEIGNADHFGDLENEVDDLSVRNDDPTSRRRGKQPFIALDGIPSSYPEPE